MTTSLASGYGVLFESGKSRFRIPLWPGFFFPGTSHTGDLTIGTPVACQALGVIGSVLGLVGPVSVYCDWVRWEVSSAASVSVWQHVKLV